MFIPAKKPMQVYLGDGQSFLLEVNGVTIVIERSMSLLCVKVEGEVKEIVSFAEVNSRKQEN